MNELAVYMDELCEYADFAGVSCACTGKLSGSLSLRVSAIIYDFLHMMFCRLYEQGVKSLLIRTGEEDGNIVVHTMQSDKIPLPDFDAKMHAEIEAAGGCVSVEVLEGLDSLGFCITFSKEGDRDA